MENKIPALAALPANSFNPVSPRAGSVHAKIRTVCDLVANMKKESQGPGYLFLSYDTAMVALRPVWSRLGLRVKFAETERSIDTTVKNRRGESMMGALSVVHCYVIDIETGEFDVNEASGYSTDASDKALAQAFTAARKSALFGEFEIATNGASNPGAPSKGVNDDGDFGNGGNRNEPPKNEPPRNGTPRNAQPAAATVTDLNRPAPEALRVNVERMIERLRASGVDIDEKKVLDKHAQGKTSLKELNFVQANAINNALSNYEKAQRKTRTPTHS